MNHVVINQRCAVMNTDYGKLKMPIEVGKEVSRILKATAVNDTSSIALAITCYKIRENKSYLNIVDESGREVCSTFGDFAEKILDVSKSYASQYASVGEVFEDVLAGGDCEWKFSQLMELLRLRKITDTNGDPITGAEIIELAESADITPASSIRSIRATVSGLLKAPEEKPIEDPSEDPEDPEDDPEDGEEAPEKKIPFLISELHEFTTDTKSSKLLCDLANYLDKMYDIGEGATE